MKKHFYSPTAASTHKLQMPQDAVREKVIRLNETVNELKMNVIQEEKELEHLEKISAKNYNQLNGHIKALRKAFNTLSDIVTEEIDGVKLEVYKELQESNNVLNRKIEDLTKAYKTSQAEEHERRVRNLAADQELRDRVKLLERKLDDQAAYFQQQNDTAREDNRVIFEKLKAVVSDHSDQIEGLQKEEERTQDALLELRSKTDFNANHTNELQKKLNDIDETVRIGNQDLNNKIEKLREKVRQENLNLTKATSDFGSRLDEALARVYGRLDSVDQSNKEKYVDLEATVSKINAESKEGLENLNQIHRETSNQIITDFERALDAIGGDARLLHKKVNTLEGSLSRHRDDISNLLSDQERRFNRRNEQINQAINDICRQTKIAYPLIS
jgi:chromosome segregation ATPase